MNSSRIFTIFLRQGFLLYRSTFRILGLFYWATLDLLLWGVLTIYLQKVGGNNFSFLSAILGGVVLVAFFTRIIQGISVSFMEDVWARNFLNLFASPLSVPEYMAGLILVSVAESVVSLAFVSFLAWLLFHYSIFQFGLLLIPFITILFLFGWAVGIFTTAFVLRHGPSAEMFVWSIPVILTPLSAVFYPVSALPKTLQYIAWAVPTSRIFEGMRAIVLHGAIDPEQLILALALSLIYFFAAYYFLWRSYRFVLRRGIFARFMTD